VFRSNVLSQYPDGSTITINGEVYFILYVNNPPSTNTWTAAPGYWYRSDNMIEYTYPYFFDSYRVQQGQRVMLFKL
jgi:hypothetical protein